MAQPYQEHYTADEYRRWEGDWELIEGMPYAIMPSPTFVHQVTTSRLAHELLNALEENGACANCEVVVEVDWQVSTDTVVRPDLVVTCQPQGEWIERTPELVAEVVSESSARRDEGLKFELYAREGVQWYLLLYPGRRLARIFQNRSGQFVKEADAGGEPVSLEVGACAITIEFGRVWPR